MNTNAMLPLTSREPMTPRGQRAWLRMALSASLMLVGAVPVLQAGDTTRVSVDSAGVQGNGFSTAPSISTNGDGRYVAFTSNATNLVPGDGNGRDDVFVHDQLSGLTTRVSVDSAGAEGDGQSFTPSISADGRWVAFASGAPNLVPDDDNFATDVFVHDRQTGLTTRVSVDSAGAQGNGFSLQPSISANGRVVVFASAASNLVPGDGNGLSDIFAHDRTTGLTTRVSVDSAAVEANGSSLRSSVSAQGRYVAFESLASNLVTGDGNGQSDVFVRDRTTGQTTRVSVDSAGDEGTLGSARPSMSDDGRYVSFVSVSAELVPGDENSASDIFMHDRLTGLTTRVSVDSAGAELNGDSDFPSMSDDGLAVAFASFASNAVSGDGNALPDVFVRQLQSGVTTRVSVGPAGVEGDLGSSAPSISANGRYVAFDSQATNLVPADGNAATDCFVHDRRGPDEDSTDAVGGLTPY